MTKIHSPLHHIKCRPSSRDDGEYILNRWNEHDNYVTTNDEEHLQFSAFVVRAIKSYDDDRALIADLVQTIEQTMIAYRDYHEANADCMKAQDKCRAVITKVQNTDLLG